MKNNSVDVIYQSHWEEGIVETTAKLDIKTGEVFDIEISDDEEVSEYEFHLFDIILDKNYKNSSDVIDCSDGFYAIAKKDIKLFLK